MLVSGGYDGRLNVFDTRKGGEPVVSMKHGNGAVVNSFSFSPTGNTFAAGCYDAGVFVYDTRRLLEGDQERAYVVEVKTGQRKVRCVHYDGRVVVAGGFSSDVVAWDVDLNAHCFTIHSRPGAASFALHTTHLASRT